MVSASNFLVQVYDNPDNDGECLYAYPNRDIQGEFYITSYNCSMGIKILCIIDAQDSLTLNPASIISPEPDLPEFPCFEDHSVVKRETSNDRVKRNIACPTGWYENEYSECLIYVTVSKNFTEAESHCTALNPNSFLMILTGTSNDYIYLWDAMKAGSIPGYDFGFEDEFWLYAQQDPIDGLWKYLTNSATNVFVNGYHIINQTSTGECITASASVNDNRKFKYDSWPCFFPRRFFCVINQILVQPTTVTPLVNITTAPTVTPLPVTTTTTPAPTNPTPVLPKFPCFSGSARKRRDASENSEGGSNSQAQKLNLMLDPSMANERLAKLEQARKDYNENFGAADLQKAYESLFEILWYSQMPCFDVRNVTSDAKDQMSVIKRCYWKEMEMACPVIFQTLPTDRGMCCAFNKEKAEDIFKKTKYGDAVKRMQQSDQDNR